MSAVAVLRSAWFAIVVAACSSEATPSTVTSSGTGAAAPNEPAVHRPAATACTGAPPEGNAIPTSGDCMTDAECTAGTNGRCIWPFGGDNVCLYDECTSDADCGVGVCACRVEASFDFNRCFQGNCVIDSDSHVGLDATLEALVRGAIGVLTRAQ